MSARDWRAVREGDTHAATKKKSNRTPESLLVGIGASGALLAGAAIILISLVGVVSFKVWPTGGGNPPGSGVGLQAAIEVGGTHQGAGSHAGGGAAAGAGGA